MMTILIIDDDFAVCTSLRLLLKQADYNVHTTQSPEKALDWLKNNVPALVLMDMNYSIETSGREGLELLRMVRQLHPFLPVILITGWASIALAVEGIKNGATDFISKPWDNDSLLQSVKNNVKWAEINQERISSSLKQLNGNYELGGIIGEHAELVEVISTAVKIAPTKATVLITGETGTGKELIAELIHNNSGRKKKPFVKLNLGGISESLFESEMFGHKKGSFTDAVSDRIGRFQMAEGGTIFLDEIAELSLASQVKLLRVLQENTFEVLGDSKSRKADVRVICATNRNLQLMVQEGSFREDLYFRINLIHIHNPALRQRPTDIPLLAKYFITRVCNENNITVKSLSKNALSMLKQQSFPGNIRELKNLMERCVLMSDNDVLDMKDISKYTEKIETSTLPKSLNGLATLDEIERESILNAMEVYKGNVSRVARTLGLSRGALYRRFEKHNISYEY